MKITIATLVLNQKEVTQQFLDTLRQNEGEEKIPLLIIDNGSTPPVRDWLKGLREDDFVIRNGENIGVLPAMNQAYQFLKNHTDFIFFVHNDVMINEKDWSGKIKRILETYPNIGCAGFYGAKGIGTPDIYKTPYFMHQLIRLHNVSGCLEMDAGVHGFRTPIAEVEDVAVLDGFSMIINTELLDKTNGFDRNLPVHHMYDNDICLESLDKGYRNIVISMNANHLGGRTDVGEDWATPMGTTKQDVHTAAHPVFYEKWREGNHTIHLPVRVQ